MLSNFDVIARDRSKSLLLVIVLRSVNNRDLSKMKFDSLDLRTSSELPSVRFIKGAPHLNL